MPDVPVYNTDETTLLDGKTLTGALASAVLGQDKTTTGSSTQNTTSGTTQNTATTGTSNTDQSSALVSALTGSSTTGTSQQTSGATSQNMTGSSTQAVSGNTLTSGTTAQTANQSQTSSGSNSTTGTQRTTGTIGTSSVQQTGGTQTTTQNADVSGLRDVLSRQLGGATPEMLQAIFREGAKAAPNLVVGQAGALGARGVGNSPMAQVLNQLNADLTSKAAMLNVQMLSDASATAGRIADLTKSSSTVSDQTARTTSDQVQDLLTATDTTQLSKQVADMVNKTVGTMAQNQASTQNTAGTQTQAVTGTSQQLQNTQQQMQQAQNQTQNQTQNTAVATTQNQAQTGTQTQTATLNKAEREQKQQVLNSNLLGKAGGLLAGGLGIMAAFKQAGAAGYVGKLKDFVSGLISQGTRPEIIDRALRADNLPSITGPDGVFDLRNLPDVDVGALLGNMPDIGSIVGDVGSDFIDWSDLFGGNYADGGKLEFLPPPNLNPTKPKLPEPDTGMALLLDALNLGGSSYFGGSSGGSSGSSGEPAAGSGGEGGAAGTDAGNVGSVSIGNIGQGTGMSNSAAGTIGAIAGALTGIPGLSSIAQGLNAAANGHAASVSAEAADMGVNAAAEAAAAEGFGVAGTMGLSAEGHAAMGEALGLSGSDAGDSSIGASSGADAGPAGADAGVGVGSGADAGPAGADAGVGVGDAGDSSGDSGGGGEGGGGGGGGGCFLTTAVTDATGGGDDDPLLETMRGFRDNVMRKDPKLSKLVDKYYQVAPAVVEAIDKRPDAKKIYAMLRENYLQPGVSAVNNGDTETALQYYSKMMEHVGEYAGNKAGEKMQAGAEQVLAGISGHANGGYIQGPGTGISDDIPASGPNGQQIRVSNGEYIIPADVVEKFGADSFDQLVKQHHVPADMQRAIFGD